METFKWFIEEITGQFAYAAGSIFWNILLFGFLGFAGGLAMIIIGRKRGWFRREFRLWSFVAKLNYLYLPLLLMVFGGVTGSFYGVKKTADHFVEKTATPLARYAQEYTYNIQTYMPEPKWAKEQDMTLSDMIALGMAEKGGLKPGSIASMAAIAINFAIIEHVLDELGVPELVRDPIGAIRVLREAAYQAYMFSDLTPKLQSVCGQFIWLKYKVVLFFFLQFLLLPLGEYLFHLIFKRVQGKVSGRSKPSSGMVQAMFLFGVAVLFSACGKEDDGAVLGLPETTYLNAKLDGEWVKTIYPKVSISRYANPDSPSDSTFWVSLFGVEPVIPFSNVLALAFLSPNIPRPGIYETIGECLDSEDCSAIAYEIEPSGNNTRTFSSGKNGEVKIKFDILEFRSGGRVKGTFTDVMLEEDTGDTIEVTEGEFDAIVD